MMLDTQYRWGSVTRTLHWLMALLILAMFVLGWTAVIYPMSPAKLKLFIWHKSIGLTTGILVLIRIFWRHTNPPPPLPESMPRWEQAASKFSHALLYTCLIIMPIAGFAASQFTKYGVTYFGMFKIPPMGSPNKVVYDWLQGVHGFTANILMILVLVHVLAALRHLVIKKDGIFNRMMPGGH